MKAGVPTTMPGPRQRPSRFRGLGEAEVDHLHPEPVPLARQDEVLGLHVAVDDPGPVGRRERRSRLAGDLAHLRRRAPPLAGEDASEVPAAEALHDEEERAVVQLAGVEQRRHSRVREPRERVRLADEPEADPRIGVQVEADDLDRHLAREAEVLREEDGPHSSFPEDREEAVAVPDDGGQEPRGVERRPVVGAPRHLREDPSAPGADGRGNDAAALHRRPRRLARRLGLGEPPPHDPDLEGAAELVRETGEEPPAGLVPRGPRGDGDGAQQLAARAARREEGRLSGRQERPRRGRLGVRARRLRNALARRGAWCSPLSSNAKTPTVGTPSARASSAATADAQEAGSSCASGRLSRSCAIRACASSSRAFVSVSSRVRSSTRASSSAAAGGGSSSAGARPRDRREEEEEHRRLSPSRSPTTGARR